MFNLLHINKAIPLRYVLLRIYIYVRGDTFEMEYYLLTEKGKKYFREV